MFPFSNFGYEADFIALNSAFHYIQAVSGPVWT